MPGATIMNRSPQAVAGGVRRSRICLDTSLAANDWIAILPSRKMNVSVTSSYTLSAVSAVHRMTPWSPSTDRYASDGTSLRALRTQPASHDAGTKRLKAMLNKSTKAEVARYELLV